MTSIAGAAGPRPVVGGTFERSLLAAAARGGVLVAIAVLAGVGLLRLTDDTAPGGPEEILTGGTESTTTTRFGGVTPGTGVDEDPGTTSGLRPPSQVRVLVLNGANISGVAQAVSDQLKAKGYQVATPDNASDQNETVAYYKPGFQGEATVVAQEVSPNAFAEELTDPPLFAGTENVDVVVVIGLEYKANQAG